MSKENVMDIYDEVDMLVRASKRSHEVYKELVDRLKYDSENILFLCRDRSSARSLMKEFVDAHIGEEMKIRTDKLEIFKDGKIYYFRDLKSTRVGLRYKTFYIGDRLEGVIGKVANL